MRTRALGPLVLAAALAVGLAAPAHAEKWAHRDPARDMYQEGPGRVPGAKQGDITHVTMNYRRHGFVLDVRVRELHRERWSHLDLFLTIPHAGGKATGRSIAYYYSIDDGSDVGVSDPRTGYPVDCKPVTASHSYAKGTLRITVPQSCIGRRAPELTAGTYFVNAWRDLQGGYVQTDDGLRKGVHRSYGHSPTLTRG